MLTDVKVLGKLWLAGWALAALVQGCTMVYQASTVGTSFAVRVTDRGRPAVNRVVTSGDRLSATTDRQEVAHFADIPPGSYLLSVASLPRLGGDLAIEVKASAAGGTVLTWESTAHFARTSSLRGTVSWAWGRNGAREPSAWALTLELKDARNDRLLERIETRGGQPFAFAKRPPGSYWLTYAGEAFGTGAIPVELTAEGPSALDLWLTESSCGSHFTNLAECSVRTLTLRRVAGRVADAMAAAIPRAGVVLANGEGRLVQQTEADEQGRFALNEVPRGRYTITVEAPGFVVFRSPVEVDEAGAAGVGEVQLAVLSGCATVRPGP